MVPIIVNGRAGSGKSTIIKKLSEKLQLPAVDVGQMFRAAARERKMELAEFGRYRDTHHEIDREIDERVMTAIRGGDKIVQSRTIPYLFQREKQPYFGVFLEVKPETQARRISERDRISVEQASQENTRRDRLDQERYQKIYGIDINDLSVYHLVVSTDDKTPDQIAEIILRKLPTRSEK
jgi:CMP/dCMP kinase